MSPTVPRKDSLDFLSDYYFDTKSPVAFTSQLALFREAKKRYSSLTFRQVKTWLQSRAERNFSISHAHICISKLRYQRQMFLI